MRVRSKTLFALLALSPVSPAAELMELRQANEAESGVFALYEEIDDLQCIELNALRDIGVSPLPEARRSEFSSNRLIGCVDKKDNFISRIDREHGYIVLNFLGDTLLKSQMRAVEVGSKATALRIDHDTFYIEQNGEERLITTLSNQLIHDNKSLRITAPIDWTFGRVISESMTYRYEQQFDEQLMRLSVGDDVFNEPFFQGGLPVRQLSLYKDFGLAPDSRAFIPDLRSQSTFQSATSLLLQVDQDNNLRLDPSSQFPLLAGDNELRYEYKDAQGITREGVKRLYVDETFLRNGLSQWRVNAGETTPIIGILNQRYRYADGYYEQNWRDDINLGVRAQYNDFNGTTLGGSIAHLQPSLGSFRLELGAHMNSDRRARALLSLSHRYNSAYFFADSRYAWRDREAGLLSDALFSNQGSVEEFRSQIGTLGRVSLRGGLVMQTLQNGEERGLVSAGASYRISNNWRVSSSWAHGFVDNDTDRFIIELVYSDPKYYGSIGHLSQDGQSGLGYQLEHYKRLRDGQVTFSAQERPGFGVRELALRGYNQSVSGFVRAFNLADDPIYQANLRGSVYLGQFGIVTQQPQSQGILLVHSSAPDMGVVLDDYRHATTNDNGIARFDNVSYFDKHLLRFDQASIPLQQRDTQGIVATRLRDFGLAYYRLPLTTNNELSLHLTHNGKSVPEGRLSVVNHVPIAPGSFLIANEPGQWRGYLDTAYGSCHFDVPAREAPGPRELTLNCVGELKDHDAQPVAPALLEYVDCQISQRGQLLFSANSEIIAQRDHNGCAVLPTSLKGAKFYDALGQVLQ